MSHASENKLRRLLQFWMIAFLSSTVVFIAFGNPLIEYFNVISAQLTPNLLPLPISEEKFWLVLTTSLMVTLIFLCYWGQKDISQNHFVVIPILVSKFTSTFFFLIFFFLHLKALAYFIGALVDGSIFIITYSFYKSYQSERLNYDL